MGQIALSLYVRTRERVIGLERLLQQLSLALRILNSLRYHSSMQYKIICRIRHKLLIIFSSLPFQLLGGACFSHGPYTFYKAVRLGHSRVLRLGSFFLTKLWSDTDLVSIGELQLLWIDNRGPNTPLASLRLYFLPENTPDGRRDTHGEVSDN